MDARLRMKLYRTAHQWHWISAAICLAALLMFSITGLTLNHAAIISAEPKTTALHVTTPASLRSALRAEPPAGTSSLAPALRHWLESQFRVSLEHSSVEWSREEIYLSFPTPGRDSWIAIDRIGGDVEYESTDRGWVAYFNDLHKGRNTSGMWRIFIDVVASACLFFSLTGLVLLQLQARQRGATWPLVGGGVGAMLLLMMYFAH